MLKKSVQLSSLHLIVEKDTTQKYGLTIHRIQWLALQVCQAWKIYLLCPDLVEVSIPSIDHL